MYSDFGTDYHYDTENKPAFTPPKSLLSLYLDARDLYLLLRRPSSSISNISTSELVSALIEAAWVTLERDAASSVSTPKLKPEDKDQLLTFFQGSQIVLLIDNLEQVPYECEGMDLLLDMLVDIFLGHYHRTELVSLILKQQMSSCNCKDASERFFFYRVIFASRPHGLYGLMLPHVSFQRNYSF